MLVSAKMHAITLQSYLQDGHCLKSADHGVNAQSNFLASIQVLRDMLGWPDVQASGQEAGASNDSSKHEQSRTLRPDKEELTSQLLVLQIVRHQTLAPPPPPPRVRARAVSWRRLSYVPRNCRILSPCRLPRVIVT